jgi:VWFA-related protein
MLVRQLLRNPPVLRVICLLSTLRPAAIFICILVGSAVFIPVKLSAQAPTAAEDVLRVSTELFVFPVRIRDKRGQEVAGLAESDLTIKDKDKVTTGLYLSAGVDQVAMVFALDQSGSLREIISQQRDAALTLFQRFSDRSLIAVLRFAEAPSIVAPFNRDLAAASEAFSFSAESNRRTAIFDAAAASLKLFDALPRVRSQRHIVVLISDGLDNASHTRADSVIDLALEKRVSFYVIHLPLFEPRDGRLTVRSPAKGFRDLAEKTGGKYFLVGDARSALASGKDNDLAPIFKAIEEDLRSQYLLGFYVGETARDGRRHRFSISLVPREIEYSLGRFGYSRSHDFFVDLPSNASKRPD